MSFKVVRAATVDEKERLVAEHGRRGEQVLGVMPHVEAAGPVMKGGTGLGDWLTLSELEGDWTLVVVDDWYDALRNDAVWERVTEVVEWASGPTEPDDSLQDETALEYMDLGRPSGDGVCSDNNCPCPEVRIPRDSGYIYISQEFVDFYQNKELLDALGGSFATFGGGPTLVCREGAELRGIDLEVAASDARHWWATGTVPLRATPSV